MIIGVTIVPSAQLRLEKISKETGQTIENIVATVAEEAAGRFFIDRDDDPAKAVLRMLKARV
jgi:hypothetical protein